MIGSTIASYPNRAYICHDCGRNLGDRYSRLRGKKQPDVIIINDKHYCSKCADKLFNEVAGQQQDETANLSVNRQIIFS